MALNIIVERNVPFLRGSLEPVANVSYLAPEEITPEAMRHTDALITRTRTRCDEALLAGSDCRFIASATIGLDHVDVDWCRDNGITVCNAPGCNAPAVAQYVMASIIAIHGSDLKGLTLGVVGAGHVGSIVLRWASALGMRTLACDPPRAEAEGSGQFCPLEQIAAEADVITFHTPLTKSGDYPTFHICGRDFLSSLRRKPTIINSARGAVVDTPALIDALESGTVGHAVIDCWEKEPDIDRRLLELADIATPHIAGYSSQGKARASHMAVKALTRYFDLPECKLSIPMPADAPQQVSIESITSSYSPEADTEALRKSPEMFEALRNNYNLRSEPLS